MIYNTKRTSARATNNTRNRSVSNIKDTVEEINEFFTAPDYQGPHQRNRQHVLEKFSYILLTQVSAD